MNTQTTEIVLRTSTDTLTRASAHAIIERVLRLMTTEIHWTEVVDLCDRGATLADAVEYTIDALNEECPSGYWYYLTADGNLALDCEDDS